MSCASVGSHQKLLPCGHSGESKAYGPISFGGCSCTITSSPSSAARRRTISMQPQLGRTSRQVVNGLHSLFLEPFGGNGLGFRAGVVVLPAGRPIDREGQCWCPSA